MNGRFSPVLFCFQIPFLLLCSYHFTSSERVIILQELSSPSIVDLIQKNQVNKEVEAIPDNALAILNAYYYAKFHGYEYSQITADEDYFTHRLGFNPSWLKLFAIHHYLTQGYEYVCYLSSKYYFSRPYLSLIDQIDSEWSPNAEVYIFYDEEEKVHIPILSNEPFPSEMQTNFMVFKNASYVRSILEYWIVSERFLENGMEYKASPPYELAPLYNYFANLMVDFLCIVSIPLSFYEDIILDRSLEHQIFIFKTKYSQSLRMLVQSQIDEFEIKYDFRLPEISDSDQLDDFVKDSLELITVIQDFYFYEWTPDYWVSTQIPLFDVQSNEWINILFRAHIQDRTFDLIIEQCEMLQINWGEIIQILKKEQDLRRELFVSKGNRLWAKDTFTKNPKLRQFLPFVLQVNVTAFGDCNTSFAPLNVPSKTIVNSKEESVPKAIVTIFAGRRNRLSIVMKYLLLALQSNIIQEVHLWDYCRDPIDREDLNLRYEHREHEGIFVKKKYTSRMAWYDYYEYYDIYGQTHPEDVIMKCDDDVVFIDIDHLNEFIEAIRWNEDTLNGVVFPNIINNGVAAHLQQNSFHMIPPVGTRFNNNSDEEWIDDFEYPRNGLCGSLWRSGEKANRLHDYFLEHWQILIRPPHPYQPEILPICSRFSINFFGMKGRNWYKLRDVGEDDEMHISVSLPQFKVMRNYMYPNLIVSHFTFGSQKLNETKKLDEYEELFEKYIQHRR